MLLSPASLKLRAPERSELTEGNFKTTGRREILAIQSDEPPQNCLQYNKISGTHSSASLKLRAPERSELTEGNFKITVRREMLAIQRDEPQK